MSNIESITKLIIEPITELNKSFEEIPIGTDNISRTNEFINVMMFKRENLINFLRQNYEYYNLVDIFNNINSGHFDDDHKPNDKYIYRILAGKYINSLYTNSSIIWIPSKELIDAIHNVVEYYDFNYIDEHNAGLAIFSGLYHASYPQTKIYAADTFTNMDTCNQLGYHPIAKRSFNEYKYYPKLKKSYPDVVISYISLISSNFVDCSDEYCNLIKSGNHSLIIIFSPITSVVLDEMLCYACVTNGYLLECFYVKTVDQYYNINCISAKFYNSGFVMYTILKKDLPSKKITSDIEQIPLSNLLKNGIFTPTMMGYNRNIIHTLKFLYMNISDKLIKSIYTSIVNCRISFTTVDSIFNYIINDNKKISIPVYICSIDELLLWKKCITSGLYFWFDNRIDFYNFFSKTNKFKVSNLKKSYPKWIINISDAYIYIYMCCTLKNENSWKNNDTVFRNRWNKLHVVNKKNLLDQLINQ